MRAVQKFFQRPWRLYETTILLLAILVGFLGFFMVTAALQVEQRHDPSGVLAPAMIPPLVVTCFLLFVHFLLVWRRMEIEQVILPVVSLIFMLGLTEIWRLRGEDGAWQQILRGFLPGMLVIALLVVRPRWVERMRRWAIPVSLLGLALPFATALFGVVDETGTRLALRIGSFSIQTSEVIKLALIIFLAWYIEREGEEVEGRARPIFGWLRLPAFRYFIPGLLFVSMATLALVAMSDFGAVLTLSILFVGMLYAGFETRIFATIAAIGLFLSALVGVVLVYTWEIPTVIQYRFLAFLDPWSTAILTVNGQSTGISISQGPGYQIQQSIYAIIAGGVSGAGLGYGSPGYVPLAHSDFIFAAVLEEMGAVIGLAILILFAILMLRILRIAMLLPESQVFERLLLVGITIHLFTQVFIMVGGTLNLIPLTGVTVPFMSLGGMALLVNLSEIGMVLAVAQRLEGPRP
jgi:cell division protein FtsW (lipid II flippase)